MTSDNNHLPYIHKTIDSLLNGDITPHRIILNIPNNNTQLPINLTLPKYKNKLIVQRCNNFKQGNNLLPTLLNKKSLGIKDGDNLLVTSEKIDYPTSFLKNMSTKSKIKNKAVINKSICKNCPSVLFKTMNIHNLDTNIPQEEIDTTPKPIEEEQNIMAEDNYNIRIPQEIQNNENIHDKDLYNFIKNSNNDKLPYDNMSDTDIMFNKLPDVNYISNTDNIVDSPQFNDTPKLDKIPNIEIDKNKKLIQPDKMYVQQKCNPANETCSYTKNQFNNKFSRIDFIPDAKKFTIVKRHLDMNNIESFTI
mgnify:FL=1